MNYTKYPWIIEDVVTGNRGYAPRTHIELPGELEDLKHTQTCLSLALFQMDVSDGKIEDWKPKYDCYHDPLFMKVEIHYSHHTWADQWDDPAPSPRALIASSLEHEVGRYILIGEDGKSVYSHLPQPSYIIPSYIIFRSRDLAEKAGEILSGNSLHAQKITKGFIRGYRKE